VGDGSGRRGDGGGSDSAREHRLHRVGISEQRAAFYTDYFALKLNEHSSIPGTWTSAGSPTRSWRAAVGRITSTACSSDSVSEQTGLHVMA
jgi:hypothetical protein